jgi:lipopolysaccharide exporter
MPSYAAMDPERRKAGMVRAAGLMALVVSPLGVGLGAVATTVVAAFFDARWAGMAPMLAILSIMSVFRPLTWSASSFLLAQRRTRLLMWMSFIRAVILLAAVAALGALGGPLWSCAAVGIAYLSHGVIMVLIIGRLEGVAAGAYLFACARPIIACAPMLLAVLGAQSLLARAGVPVVASLLIEVLVGGLVYVAAAFLFARPLATDLLQLARRSLGRPRA